MASDSISFTVTFRGVPHTLAISPTTTLAELHLQLEELTGVPPALQKLLYKNKKSPGNNGIEQMTVTHAGLKNGIKVQMLGSTTQDIDGLRVVENEHTRVERILRERAMKAPIKLRSSGSGPISTISSSSSPAFQYRFHSLKALEHLPDPSSALSLLTKLSEDPAIKHIMQQHKFSVGLLTELAPHEHPELLGLNENAGQAIKLRLRTNKYDGFRMYKEVRRVLCHELTHNVWGDHDDNFKELNSQLNREVANFEISASEGTHYLSDPADIYQPSSELPVVPEETNTYVLGGTGSRSSSSESAEERRSRVLKATMNRLLRNEEDIEHSCGTGRNATSST